MINLSPLLKLFNQISEYDSLLNAIYSNEETTNPLGIMAGARPAFLAALHAEFNRPILFITASADRARILTEQIQAWVGEPDCVYRFPDPDSLPYEKVVWGSETIQRRLSALSALYNNKSSTPICVLSARGLMSHTLPPSKFVMSSLVAGQRINLNELVRGWVELGYQPEDIVEIPGSFSRRGGILDIFPSNSLMPVRIELFGDEIDSLRTFDPATQRSENRLKSFTVSPATETLPQYATQAAALLNQCDMTNLQPGTVINLEEDIERLAQGAVLRGFEHYLPFFYSNNGSKSATILDYLPDNALVFIEEPADLALVVDELDKEASTLKQNLVNVGDLPSKWPTPYFGWQSLSEKLADCKPILLGFTNFNRANGSTTAPQEQKFPLQFSFAPAPVFGGQVKKVLQDIIKRKKNGERVILVSRQAARLSHLLEEHNMTVAPLEQLPHGDPPPPSGSITIVQGMLIGGWIMRDGQNGDNKNQALITVMSDSELFGWKKPTTIRRRKRRRGVTPETFFADVNPSDFVVHIEYGVGQYFGLVKLDFEGVQREYLVVKYANNDKLYVPIHQADRLARYVGVGDDSPLLNRLGSADWKTVKRRTKKAVEDIAKELLEIYAKREISSGYAFGADTEWQSEVEDSFPFVETDDQLHAIDDVKTDMEKARPMDRLICGDVGYGKTEVALRAAFKAVMDGTQVVVLSPTTILAQQHFQTFSKRLVAYPVKIEMMSRFRTKSQQQRTLQNMADGTADIVIGTHRLVQKDVVFKNLGLLIIDEEQRFGVKQKEKLKAMRAKIDVLTLTATPIPRTLYMSLSGVRDMSTIDTPPEERLPIKTTVTEYDENLIRQAVLREIERGGQVFYVYNRVMGIEQKANRMRNILPETRIGVGHGQMSPRQLERVMVDFVSGKYDILVSTTIIENGLDMPNVNTIIIDRADRMGLSQLYQLRGRVGRGAVRAYAYLLTPKHYELKADARKRLDAIIEAGELGAGFRIAMRDLEIRGAGEFLGAKQHGHITAVGYDLYSRLLGQAIRELQGESPNLVIGEEAGAYLNPLSDGIQMNLPVPAYVPDDYLPEEKLRLRLYRRLAGLTSLDAVAEMAKELEDRFGDMPQPVVNLLYQLKLKVLAMETGVKSIVAESDQIIIRTNSLAEIDRGGLQRRLSPSARITTRQVSLSLHPDEEVWQAELEKTLRLIHRMLYDPAG